MTGHSGLAFHQAPHAFGQGFDIGGVSSPGDPSKP